MNNNIQQQQIIILPLYLQKYIIKIICEYINRKVIFKKAILSSNNNLIVKLSLVCWKYHEFISSQLYCCQDFNYIPLEKNFYPPPPLSGRKKYMFKNSKYSIYKFENIKTLKLHHREYRYHENDIETMLNWLNENLLSKLINLKTIFIDIEHKINSNAVFGVDFVNSLKMPNNNVNIEISKISLSYFDKELVSNVTQLNSLLIDQSKPINNISKLLNRSIKVNAIKIQKSPTIIDEKNFMILNSESYIDEDEIRNIYYYDKGTTNSKLTLNFNVEYFNSKYNPMVNDIFKYVSLFRIQYASLTGLISILTSYPNLKELTFSTCFSNLERLLKSDNNSTSSDRIKKCICTKYHTLDIDIWNLFVEKLQNSKSLTTLTIMDLCLNTPLRQLEKEEIEEMEKENDQENDQDIYSYLKPVEPKISDCNYYFLSHILKYCSSTLKSLNIHVDSRDINPLYEIINSNKHITNYKFFYRLINKTTIDKQKLDQLLSNHENQNINLTIFNSFSNVYTYLHK